MSQISEMEELSHISRTLWKGMQHLCILCFTLHFFFTFIPCWQ